VANQLNESTEKLFKGADVNTSFRAKVDSLVDKFFTDGEEVQAYLDKAAIASGKRWGEMDKKMKRFQQAAQAVDPKHKGNFLGFGLLPMIFGNNSRSVPFDFERLVTDVEEVLEALLEKVVDLVVEHVNMMIDPSGSSLLLTNPAAVVLRESFTHRSISKSITNILVILLILLILRFPGSTCFSISAGISKTLILAAEYPFKRHVQVRPQSRWLSRLSPGERCSHTYV